MTLRTQRAVLAAKTEAVEGTAETLTAANGILALGATFQKATDMIARNPFRPTLSQLASIPGKRTATISAQVEAKGSGTAGTPPEWGALLTACGMGVTNVPIVSDTYAPISTGDTTDTVALYQDGIRHLIAGCRGNFTMGGAVGEILVVNFDMLGIEDSTTDTAIISPTYQSTVPEPLMNMTFTLHGAASVVGSSFSLDMGNVLTPRQDFTKASGHASVFLGDRVPVANFVIEKPLVAVKDWYGIWDSGTESTISLILGASAGNIITITSSKFQVTNIAEQDDGGKAMLSIDGKLNLTSGDDELSIAFT